jgi:hypothetical protein
MVDIGQLRLGQLAGVTLLVGHQRLFGGEHALLIGVDLAFQERGRRQRLGLLVQADLLHILVLQGLDDALALAAVVPCQADGEHVVAVRSGIQALAQPLVARVLGARIDVDGPIQVRLAQGRVQKAAGQIVFDQILEQDDVLLGRADPDVLDRRHAQLLGHIIVADDAGGGARRVGFGAQQQRADHDAGDGAQRNKKQPAVPEKRVGDPVGYPGVDSNAIHGYKAS